MPHIMLKIRLALLATISLICLCNCAVISVGCGVATQDAVYDLKELARPLDYSWTVRISDNETLSFGICQPMTSCYSRYSSTWAKIYEAGICTGSVTQEGDPTFSRWNLNNGTTNELSVTAINYTDLGLKCKNSNETYKLVVYVACDKSITDDKAVPLLLHSSSSCMYEILLSVDKGCPIVSWSEFWDLVGYFWPIGSIFFLAVGTFIGIFGRAMWNKIVLGLFAITFISLFSIVSYEALPLNAPVWGVGFALLLSVAFGVPAAYYAAKHQAAGFILLGAWMGASFTIVLQNFIVRACVSGLLLYTVRSAGFVKSIAYAAGLLFIPLIYTLFVNEVTFWISFISTTLICGVIAYSVKELLITIATSFIGAYLVVRGIALSVGGYPGLGLMYDEIKDGKIDFSLALTIYAFIIFLLTILFIFVQEYMAKKDYERKHEKLNIEIEDDVGSYKPLEGI